MRASHSLAPEVKERLICLAPHDRGWGVIIEGKRYRTQEQNRLDALARLVKLVQKALEIPKACPSVTSSAARVDEKKRRGVIKRTRRYNPDNWEG